VSPPVCDLPHKKQRLMLNAGVERDHRTGPRTSDACLQQPPEQDDELSENPAKEVFPPARAKTASKRRASVLVENEEPEDTANQDVEEPEEVADQDIETHSFGTTLNPAMDAPTVDHDPDYQVRTSLFDLS
jgi:hypothetical protein